MAAEEKTILENGIEVSFYPDNGSIKSMKRLAASNDFLKETEVMKRFGNDMPFNLLVYDDFLALGLYGEDSGRVGVSAAIRDYSQDCLTDWTDMSLSLFSHPIRVIEKTSKKGLLTERLQSRLSLDWLDFDEPSGVLREVFGKQCPAERYFRQMPANRELLALMQYGGKIQVIQIRIDKDVVLERKKGLLATSIKSRKSGDNLYLKMSYEQAEEQLREEHPDALIIREPLTYCSQACNAKPYSCLAIKFEQVYASKFPSTQAAIDSLSSPTSPTSRFGRRF